MPSNPAETICCEQAIFTSARTMAGQGYQITAASGGLSPEELADIIRRCPSHGNLESEDESATGLLSWINPHGRRCIGYCCHAGREPSGRAGLRVLTHVAVLDQTAFHHMNTDPLHVHTLLAKAPRPTRVGLCPPDRLAPLQLQFPELTTEAQRHRENIETSKRRNVETGGGWHGSVLRPVVDQEGVSARAEARGSLLTRLLEDVVRELGAGNRLMLTHVAEPMGLLADVFRTAPDATRNTLTASVGLRFSPARDMQFVLLKGELDPAGWASCPAQLLVRDTRALLSEHVQPCCGETADDCTGRPAARGGGRYIVDRNR